MKIPYNGNRHSGLRFARSAREAYGHEVHFAARTRNPDWIVGAVCAAGFVLLTVMGWW